VVSISICADKPVYLCTSTNKSYGKKKFLHVSTNISTETLSFANASPKRIYIFFFFDMETHIYLIFLNSNRSVVFGSDNIKRWHAVLYYHTTGRNRFSAQPHRRRRWKPIVGSCIRKYDVCHKCASAWIYFGARPQPQIPWGTSRKEYKSSTWSGDYMQASLQFAVRDTK
jgi:hypothetical protein